MAKASLITGATSGIGKGVVLELAARADVIGVLAARPIAEEAVHAIGPAARRWWWPM